MIGNTTKVLIFHINDISYATDIMEVERILGYETPTILPESPDFVEGVINYEGNILPLINLSKRFNMLQDGDITEGKIIVAKQEKGKIGIIVDIVSEVKDVESEKIETPPEVVSGISKRYVKGLIKDDEDIIILLNLSTVLSDKEKEML